MWASFIAWFTFGVVILLVLDFLMQITKRVRTLYYALTNQTPNVQHDVRNLSIENLNVSQDPTAPERYAAVNEYFEHRRR